MILIVTTFVSLSFSSVLGVTVLRLRVGEVGILVQISCTRCCCTGAINFCDRAGMTCEVLLLYSLYFAGATAGELACALECLVFPSGADHAALWAFHSSDFWTSLFRAAHASLLRFVNLSPLTTVDGFGTRNILRFISRHSLFECGATGFHQQSLHDGYSPLHFDVSCLGSVCMFLET